jgi:hypothetical protein
MGDQENNSSSESGFLLWLVILALIGFFAWIAIPNFINTRATSTTMPCINQLRQIDAAANEFALENHKTNGDAINFPDDLTPFIKLNSEGKIWPCPQGGFYSLKKVGDKPTCSLGATVTPAHILP